MRKLFVSLLAVVTLGFGSALAQDAFGNTVELSPNYYAGVGGGLNYRNAAFVMHFGISDLITDGIGTRFSVLYNGAFGLGADVIANLPINTGNAPLGIYAGAGLNMMFVNRATAINIGILLGGEYRFAGFQEGGVFLELGPAFSINGYGNAFNFKAGFNYHF